MAADSSPNSGASKPSRARSSKGRVNTHCRSGTPRGSTWSMMLAELCAMRLPRHDGQKPLRLQLSAITFVCEHISQTSGAAPRQSTPPAFEDANTSVGYCTWLNAAANFTTGTSSRLGRIKVRVLSSAPPDGGGYVSGATSKLQGLRISGGHFSRTLTRLPLSTRLFDAVAALRAARATVKCGPPGV
jgi:hypothetical protein